MIWVALAVFAIVAVTPFILERRKPDMSPQLRDKVTEGSFAHLSDGHTYFRWHGPETGPVLVCVHGLTTPSYVWDELMPGLTGAGFRVLTYDLYGRGLSDRPSGAQTRSFFIRQLRDLLQDQQVIGPISIMGYSMGGAIAAIFAAEEPERVDRVVLLAPAGMIHVPTRFSEFVRKGGRTGEWLMLSIGGRELRKYARETPWDTKLAERVADETRWRGYLPAVLSSQRHLLKSNLEEEHRDLRRLQVPVISIWGESDTVIPTRGLAMLSEWNRDAKQSMIPAAGHGLPVTHADQVLTEFARLLQA